ncbi:MAG: efflux RND transporter periplasmic adaptor subunit [Planctomycetota bacterium]|nr:efflux RND transporter periplasmic adaptor subunit [Planctomycetota bacterium]
MNSRREPPLHDSAEPWRGIDELLAEISHLARQGRPVEEFARALVGRIVASLSTGAVTFWELPRSRSPRIVADAHAAPGPVRRHEEAIVSREEVLRTAVAEGGYAEKSLLSAGEANETWSLCCVIDFDEHATRLLELTATFRDAASRSWAGEVLKSVGELCGDFFREERLAQLTARDALWQRLVEVAAGWRQELAVDRLGKRIVHDLRPLAQCDRVSLLTTGTGGCRVIAVSGADQVSRRGDAMLAMERLAEAIVAQHASVWLESGSSESVEIDSAVVTHYFDTAGSRWLGMVPLELVSSQGDQPDTPGIVGVLLVEGFSEPEGTMTRQVVPMAAPLIAASLAAARMVGRIPLSRWWLGKGWQNATAPARRWRWWLAAAVAIVAIACWPVRFEIEARGELQPVARRDLFAPVDARVSSLNVEHAAEVAEGDLLLELRSPELELEYERVWGELETTGRKLSAIEAARGAGGGDRPDRDSRSNQLSGDESALREQLASLREQLRLVKEQQSTLDVRSPISGRVLTWNAADLLQGRPVRRGQMLLSVADVSGAWTLELRVANRRAGHILDASQNQPEGLPMSYVLAIDPGTSHVAKVTRVASAVEREPGDEPFVRIRVEVPPSEFHDPRPGSGVTAQIDCGHRPLVYAWFHELIDAARGWLAL